MPKGNSSQLPGFQSQNWGDLSYKLDRVREVAGRDKRLRFTTLLHHVTPRLLLLDAYTALRKDAASGVDEVTWREYQKGLGRRLLDLHGKGFAFDPKEEPYGVIPHVRNCAGGVGKPTFLPQSCGLEKQAGSLHHKCRY